MDDQLAQGKQGSETPLAAPEGMLQPLLKPSESSVVQSSLADKQSAALPVLTASDYHPKFSEELHNYLREYIRNADQKAAFFFAGATAMLAFLHSHQGTAHWLKDIRTWSLIDTLSFVALLALALSACALLGVVFPRLKGSKRGLIFFSAIAEHDSAREYTTEVLRRSVDELVTAKLQHAYDLSKVCVAKYQMLHLGFWIGSVGLGSALLFLMLSPSN